MKKLLGGILQTVGALIAGASGLCSLGFIISMLSGPGGYAGLLILVIPIGGLPFLIGLGLFKWGRSIVRQAEAEAQDLDD